MIFLQFHDYIKTTDHCVFDGLTKSFVYLNFYSPLVFSECSFWTLSGLSSLSKAIKLLFTDMRRSNWKSY